uniref:Uncharacterized protein n=1 Tax=viral metagenome TaxID=1070528 RepID=A0A6C0LPT9_9ZZZZ
MATMEELRRHRVLNLTLIDLIPTMLIGLIIHSYLWLYPLELSSEEQSNRTFIQYTASLAIILITLLGLGIIMHRLFGIMSGLSAHLGLNGKPNKKII